MIKSYKTEQEKFWASDFGSGYIERNTYEKLLPSYVYQWAHILSKTSGVHSVIEFGANTGANLKALQILKPDIEPAAVEINHKACSCYLSGFIKPENLFETSILEFSPDRQFDLSFTKGVLIHINPDELQTAYEKLYLSSKKYIVIAEYYNPSPVTIQYRGNSDRLFKRDFAGEFMDKYSDVKLVDYGFFYHRDNNFKADDLSWFLTEKV